jgi:hypothetical protein
MSVVYWLSCCPESMTANLLAICTGWLLKTHLSTVTKPNTENKTFYLHITQPLQIAFVGGCVAFSSLHS